MALPAASSIAMPDRVCRTRCLAVSDLCVTVSDRVLWIHHVPSLSDLCVTVSDRALCIHHVSARLTVSVGIVLDLANGSHGNLWKPVLPLYPLISA